LQGFCLFLTQGQHRVCLWKHQFQRKVFLSFFSPACSFNGSAI
jgi:hypothetical protein